MSTGLTVTGPKAGSLPESGGVDLSAGAGHGVETRRGKNMDLNTLIIILGGVVVGIGASFSGLGGGFLMIPFLLTMGFSAQKAVGTSFLAILVISISALVAHNKFANVDYKYGILLGIGGIVGAQIGARLVVHVDTVIFKKIFAAILVGLAVYIFMKK